MSDEVKSDADGSSETKTYSEEQFKGLLADKQAEVKKRQALEAELSELKAKRVETPAKADDSTNGDDVPMTVSQFKKLLAEERQAESDKAFNLLEAESALEAKQSFTAEKTGDGLDYESVISLGEANLSEGDKLAIRQSKNPAAEKYRRCIFNTPELSEKAEAVRTAKLLENIKLNGRVPVSGGVATNANSGKDISSMSEEELDKLAAEIE